MKQAHAHEKLFLAGNVKRLVAVADTHSKPHPDSHARIATLSPDVILHCGDIGDYAVISDLEKLAPVIAVRGNIDAAATDMQVPDSVTVQVEDKSGVLLTFLMIHIAVYGPKLRADVARLASKEGASLVVCGHSHVPFMGRDKGITMFNPGSIGPRRFTLPIVFGVIEVSREQVTLRHIDCETGEVWRPTPSLRL